MTNTSIKDLVLEQVLYIYYPVQFEKDKVKILISLSIKINVITFMFATILGLKICFTKLVFFNFL